MKDLPFQLKDTKISKPIMVVGLPGIGNVGKIVTDYVIEQLKAKEIGKFYIDTPPMVFPTKDGIEFPSVKLYHATSQKNSFLFIAGDYQPRESKCFDFCSQIIDLFKRLKGKSIIILGGASLPDVDADPSIYAISSKTALIEKYRKIDPSLKSAHGNLGPIVGVAGVLLGLSKDKNIDATAFLIETTDKEYFNAKSVRKALQLLNKLTGISINTKKFDSQMKNMGAEISAIQNFMKDEATEKSKTKEEMGGVGYIG